MIIRKFVGIVALGLCLSACATGPSSTSNVSETVKQVQSAVRIGCSFVPTVATIANILSSGYTNGISAMASDICTAVTTAPLADGSRRTPKVNGVVVKGSFVK